MAMIMHVAGIAGESKIAGFPDWTPITDFGWGGERNLTHEYDQSQREGALLLAPNLRHVTVRKMADRSMSALWTLMLSEAEVTVRFAWLRTGADRLEPYLQLELDKARIAGIEEISGGAYPTEEIRFTYDALTFNVTNVGDDLSGAQDVVHYDVGVHTGG